MPRREPPWSEIRKLGRKVLRHMPSDTFLKTVFAGCFRVAQDRENPLRGNLLASGIREAVGHILHSLAPDDEVRRCVWFVQAKDTPTVTRRQRAEYIVRGGLPDQFIEDQLHISLSQFTNPLLAAIDDLNKATHVRPHTIVAGGLAVRRLFNEFLVELDQFFEAAGDARKAITNAVSEVMDQAVFENLISEVVQELDELSSHTVVDGHYIDSVKVKRLSATKIVYRISGAVEVELQYGSNSDVENDIGFRQDDSYPYTASVTCKAAEPMTIRSEDIVLKVDNSSFYE